jgi:5-methylcytosine-specific restriction endonuclease McrA
MGIVVFFLLCTGGDLGYRTAYTVLQTGQHVFEPERPEREATPPPRLYNKTTTAASATIAKGRPYLSPFVKKQVAAKQKWRCAVCRELLDETYEIDHIRPLHYAKNETEKRELNAIDNLQALCRRDHLAKSAMEAQG